MIEVLHVVAIITILTFAVYAMIENGRKRAKVNSAKTTLKSLMTSLVSCGVSNSGVANVGIVGAQICPAFPSYFWPKLPGSYSIIVAGGDFSDNCIFEVSTDGDTVSNLVCNCVRQLCE